MIKYPEYAEIRGKKYKLNTDYRVAIKCFEVVNDQKIGDYERAMAIIYLIFGFIPENNQDLFMEKAILFLQCGKENAESDPSKRDMDFSADSGYINASFMSDYHIDLPSTDMHFWKYIELIQGLTDKCILSRVREIRDYDLSEVKDSKTRGKIIRAKEAVKLPIVRTQEEQEAIDRFEKLLEGEVL